MAASRACGECCALLSWPASPSSPASPGFSRLAHFARFAHFYAHDIQLLPPQSRAEGVVCALHGDKEAVDTARPERSALERLVGLLRQARPRHQEGRHSAEVPQVASGVLRGAARAEGSFARASAQAPRTARGSRWAGGCCREAGHGTSCERDAGSRRCGGGSSARGRGSGGATELVVDPGLAID
eukprot:scaffold1941_cov263-Pinguiococcus_pyrenoidosus.AAC.24